MPMAMYEAQSGTSGCWKEPGSTQYLQGCVQWDSVSYRDKVCSHVVKQVGKRSHILSSSFNLTATSNNCQLMGQIAVPLFNNTGPVKCQMLQLKSPCYYTSLGVIRTIDPDTDPCLFEGSRVAELKTQQEWDDAMQFLKVVGKECKYSQKQLLNPVITGPTNPKLGCDVLQNCFYY